LLPEKRRELVYLKPVLEARVGKILKVVGQQGVFSANQRAEFFTSANHERANPLWNPPTPAFAHPKL